MAIVDRGAVVQSSQALLRPLASLLLKCGMTWLEFAQVSKRVFVEVASGEYGIRGRQTNVSRVAILTGIGRREVGKLRQLLTVEDVPLPDKTTDATRLLSGWHQDPDFTTPAGRPRNLSRSGKRASFDELARRYAADVPPSTMLKELKRVDAVVELPDGKLRVKRRYYQPAQLDTQWILNAGSVFADLGANINHNLTAGEANPSWFLGRATNDRIDPAAVKDFQAFLEQQGEQFLERVDDWLTRHRAKSKGGQPGVRLGVGLFMIKGAADKGTLQ